MGNGGPVSSEMSGVTDLERLKELFGVIRCGETPEEQDAAEEEVADVVLRLLSTVEAQRQALLKITREDWQPETMETPFQFEQRIHKVAAAALAAVLPTTEPYVHAGVRGSSCSGVVAPPVTSLERNTVNLTPYRAVGDEPAGVPPTTEET
jgi:hypothetical protein